MRAGKNYISQQAPERGSPRLRSAPSRLAGGVRWLIVSAAAVRWEGTGRDGTGRGSCRARPAVGEQPLERGGGRGAWREMGGAGARVAQQVQGAVAGGRQGCLAPGRGGGDLA